MDCDVSWKSRWSKLNDETVLLKTQVDFVVQERENIKLEYQKLFNSTRGVGSSNSVRRLKSKDTKTKNSVSKNTNDKCSSAHVRKVSSSVRIYSKKHETMNSQYYSRVKRALFTTPVAAKSKNLGVTSVVAKSRLSVAKIPTSTNK
ncbi:hypothetical protein Tco_0929612, partial [Tanacetum coccineum]